MSFIDKTIGLHAQSLSVRSQRTQLLAENLANADTPGYKARDIDFRALMSNAQPGPVRMANTAAGHLAADDAPRFEPLYRVPLGPSLDGNTVTAHVEQASFAENAVRYQASLMFLNRKLSGLRAAMSQE